MGYVTATIDTDDVIDQLSDSELKDELERRGFIVLEDEEDDETVDPLEYVRSLSGDSLRRFICDFAYLGYHSSKVEIMNAINERIK